MVTPKEAGKVASRIKRGDYTADDCRALAAYLRTKTSKRGRPPQFTVAQLESLAIRAPGRKRDISSAPVAKTVDPDPESDPAPAPASAPPPVDIAAPDESTPAPDESTPAPGESTPAPDESTPAPAPSSASGTPPPVDLGTAPGAPGTENLPPWLATVDADRLADAYVTWLQLETDEDVPEGGLRALRDSLLTGVVRPATVATVTKWLPVVMEQIGGADVPPEPIALAPGAVVLLRKWRKKRAKVAAVPDARPAPPDPLDIPATPPPPAPPPPAPPPPPPRRDDDDAIPWQ